MEKGKGISRKIERAFLFCYCDPTGFAQFKWTTDPELIPNSFTWIGNWFELQVDERYTIGRYQQTWPARLMGDGEYNGNYLGVGIRDGIAKIVGTDIRQYIQFTQQHS